MEVPESYRPVIRRGDDVMAGGASRTGRKDLEYRKTLNNGGEIRTEGSSDEEVGAGGYSTPRGSPTKVKAGRGKPSNATRLQSYAREKGGSLGSLDNIFGKAKIEKRKREEGGPEREEERERAQVFRSSKLLNRSPVKGERVRNEGREWGGGESEEERERYKRLDRKESPRGEEERRKEVGREREEKEGMKEWLEGFKADMMKELAEARKEIKEEVGSLAGKLEESNRQWRQEKEILEGRIKKLEEERTDWKKREEESRRKWEEKMDTERARREEEGQGQGGEAEARHLKNRVEEIEAALEKKEKVDRRLNILIRGEEYDRAADKERMAREILKAAGGEAGGIEEMTKVGGERGGFMKVKVRSWEVKREVMKGKKNLRGRKAYLDDDLTVKEREVQRMIASRARELREEGHRVSVGYRKMWVDDRRCDWDDREKAIGRGYGSRGRNEEERGTIRKTQ